MSDIWTFIDPPAWVCRLPNVWASGPLTVVISLAIPPDLEYLEFARMANPPGWYAQSDEKLGISHYRFRIDHDKHTLHRAKA